MVERRLSYRSSATLSVVLLLGLPCSAIAQVGVLAPAEAARERAEEQPPSAATDPDAREPSYRARARAKGPSELREEERIGDYAQPRWTARRRFPTTRVYVVPAGKIGVEWWLQDKQSLSDKDGVRYRSLYELEFGLGHRLQLDVYLQTEQRGHQGEIQIGAEKVELRYALADWGQIPLNPTLYLEFVRNHAEPPAVEAKALFGEELAPRWHTGFNLVFEHALGGDLTNEYAVTWGLSYSVTDETFSIGGEVKLETVDHEGDRFSFDAWEVLAGPSLAWSPVPAMHLLLAPLFGSEHEEGEDTPLLEATLIAGWEL
jgi:hypothetical protein